MQHKEFIARLRVEGLYQIYMDEENQDRYTREEKMAVKHCWALAMKEPVYSVEQLQKEIGSYFEMVDQKENELLANTGKVVKMKGRRPYTLEGLCNHLCITKKTFEKWCNDEKFKEYNYLCQLAKQMITQKVLEGGLMKEYDASLAKFYVRNTSDLTDKKDDKKELAGANITFVTVKSREDFQALQQAGNAFNGEIVDTELVE